MLSFFLAADPCKDLQHKVWEIALNGHLYVAPIEHESLNEALDVGCGTGGASTFQFPVLSKISFCSFERRVLASSVTVFGKRLILERSLVYRFRRCPPWRTSLGNRSLSNPTPQRSDKLPIYCRRRQRGMGLWGAIRLHSYPNSTSRSKRLEKGAAASLWRLEAWRMDRAARIPHPNRL